MHQASTGLPRGQPKWRRRERRWLVWACWRWCLLREGLASLNEQDESEEDLLDRAWGLEPNSRLSCQAILAQTDVVVEIPRYSINHAKENH